MNLSQEQILIYLIKIAINYDNDALLSKLLYKQENINKLCFTIASSGGIDHEVTLIHYACHKGAVNSIKYLVENNIIDINIVNKDGKNLLSYLKGSNSASIIEYCITKGIDLNKSSHKGSTPLHEAVWNDEIEAVKALIEFGANIEVTDKRGQTPIYVAAITGNNEIVKILISNNAKIDEKQGKLNFTPLMRAAFNGHNEVVKTLINNNARIEEKEGNNFTPLMRAAAHGYNEVVKTLIEVGANINALDNDNSTLLVVPAIDGNIELAEILFHYGLNVNACNKHGKTPLHFAAAKGKFAVAKIFIEKGAVIDARDSEGVTPLFNAALGWHSDTVKLLIMNGAAKLSAKNFNSYEAIDNLFMIQDYADDLLKDGKFSEKVLLSNEAKEIILARITTIVNKLSISERIRVLDKIVEGLRVDFIEERICQSDYKFFIESKGAIRNHCIGAEVKFLSVIKLLQARNQEIEDSGDALLILPPIPIVKHILSFVTPAGYSLWVGQKKPEYIEQGKVDLHEISNEVGQQDIGLGIKEFHDSSGRELSGSDRFIDQID
ncbi:MAG: uncharacterized protein K0Q51_1586 [Rickettsiaceae bacterium]|jgi:ankyrin repeat protein|nr:uncharacterized protein [Rickettsiaceae bacterium]